jgi:demethylspheroidene O-methyltransferase
VPRDRAIAPWFSLRPERLIAKPRFQDIVSRLPFARSFARRDGAKIFDLLQGFVASQVLTALVELGILRRLLNRPMSAGAIGLASGIAEERIALLLRAGTALRLLKQRRDGRYALARRGAAILGVPGLEAMIAHNRAFYADMADPVALLREPGVTRLARFWPYVLGSDAADDPEAANRYSDLMAKSQVLVAQDTLQMVSFAGVSRLMDVGGGSGAFLSAVLERYPSLDGTLVDLPDVMPLAEATLARMGLSSRVQLCPLSFREEPLPRSADAISIVRVLYDHADPTVAALLNACFSALPPGGRLIISEPMSGGATPDSATDVYFAFYTALMGTGRVRSAAEIAAMCKSAGFTDIRAPKPHRPYITAVVTAVKPS